MAEIKTQKSRKSRIKAARRTIRKSFETKLLSIFLSISKEIQYK